MRNERRWVCRSGKIPIDPKTGKGASSTDPSTWSDFETAVKAAERYSGIGFVLGGGYMGVDLDHCDDAIAAWKRGETKNLVGEVITTLQSYAEYSPSGAGIHVICKGTKPAGRKKNSALGVEMYDCDRYFTVTGNPASTFLTLSDATETIKPLYAKYLGEQQETPAPPPSVQSLSLDDAELLRKARAAKNGQAFTRLYDVGNVGGEDDSGLDLSLCNMLAFWTGCDATQMDRLFRGSALMRDKWDSRRGGTTYGAITISEAISKCRQVYEPRTAAQTEFAVIVNGQEAQAPTEPIPLPLVAAEVDFTGVPDPIWIIDEILPEGVTFLEAFAKVGKSQFEMQMCIAVAAGLDFIGFRTHKSGVLYIATEDERTDFYPRFRRSLRGMPKPENFYFFTKEAFPDTPRLGQSNGLTAVIRQAVEAYPDIKLVCVDTYNFVKGEKTGNDFTEAELKDVRELLDVAGSLHIALVVAHHVGKNSARSLAAGADFVGAGAGSFNIGAAVHSIWYLSRDAENKERRNFAFRGRRIRDGELILENEFPHFRLLGDYSEVREREDKVIAVVTELMQRFPEWKGSAKELKTVSGELCEETNGRVPQITETLNKNAIASRVQGLRKRGIEYTLIKNGRSGAAKHKFMRSALWRDGFAEITDSYAIHIGGTAPLEWESEIE